MCLVFWDWWLVFEVMVATRLYSLVGSFPFFLNDIILEIMSLPSFDRPSRKAQEDEITDETIFWDITRT